MPSLGITTSNGHQLAYNILVKLLKLIGASANINGHGDYNKRSITELLIISQLEMVFLLEKCGLLVDKKRLQQLVGNKAGCKEYCKEIPCRVTKKDKNQKLLHFLRIGLVQGESAIPSPKHQFKKGELVELPIRSFSPRLQSMETNQIELLKRSSKKTEGEQKDDPQVQTKGQQGAACSETKSMSEFELEMIRNIATIFAGKEDPSKVTQHEHHSIQRYFQNFISGAAQLACVVNFSPAFHHYLCATRKR
jgi:hypothetical protein